MMSGPPTRESRPGRGAASQKTFRGVTAMVSEPTITRLLASQVSRWCATCRRHLHGETDARQHTQRRHVVEVTTTTVTITGTAADVDARLAGRWGWGA